MSHQHILDYLVPYNDVEDTVKEIISNLFYHNKTDRQTDRQTALPDRQTRQKDDCSCYSNHETDTNTLLSTTHTETDRQTDRHRETGLT